MITHEEARKIAQDMLPKQVGSISSRNKVKNYFQLDLYFKQQQAKDKVHEELVRDVKRYFELINSDEWTGGEVENLREEIILKVGVNE